MPATINWSGYTWDVRDQTLSGPGPNYWSNSAENIEVDGTELVVSIVHNGPAGSWTCTEITCHEHLGYGTYTWVVNSPLDDLDVNDVLGLFTYGGPAPGFNEIDIEAAHWGNPAWPGGSGTVWQDASANERVFGEFDWTDNPPYVCKFRWESGRVSFLVTDDADTVLFDWSLANGDLADSGFSDNFNFGTVPNFANWTRFGAITPTLSAGQVLLQSTAAGTEYAGISTARTYDMVGATCTVKAIPSPVSGSHECTLEIVKPDDSARVMLALSSTFLYYGASGALVEDHAYSPTDDAWWRITEAAGTTTFYTSPNGTSWTVLGTMATPAWMGDAKVQLAAGHFSAQPADTQTRFDNFSLATTGSAGALLIPVPSTEKPYLNYWRNEGEVPSVSSSIRIASFEYESLIPDVDVDGSGGGVVVPAGLARQGGGRPRWQFILCETPDPTDPTGELFEIGELEKARNRSVDIIRNRAGTASCQISIHDDFIPVLLDKVPLGDIRGTLRKSLLVRRNKEDLWAGPITSIQGSLGEGGGFIDISAVGWFEYLQYRELIAAKHYTERPLNEIAFDLLHILNSQEPDYPIPIFPGSVVGESLASTLFSPTFAKGDTLGASIQKLSDVENGFDFEVDPRTRELNIYAWDSYTVRPNIRLGYRWGPENIAKLDWTESGGNTRNRVTVTNANNAPVTVQDEDAIAEYGLFKETINLPINTTEQLAPYAVAELIVKARPPVTYTISPKAVGLLDDGSPHLFEDYFIGDQIAFTAVEGYFEVRNQGMRVFGASISISDDGVETINNLQTTPAT